MIASSFGITSLWRRACCALVAALALASALGLSAVPARAAIKHNYESQLTGVGNPVALAVAASGDLLVLDRAGSDVQRFDAAGAPLAFTAPVPYVEGGKLTGTPAGPFATPSGVAVDDVTGNVYVSDSGRSVVDVFNSSGEYLSQITETPPSAPVSGALREPAPLAFDQSRHELYVSDLTAGVVDVFDSSGAYVAQFGAGVYNPHYAETVAVDQLMGNAYVADSGPDAVYVFSSLGGFLPPSWEGAGTPAGSFGRGNGYVFVGVNPTSGHVYVADTFHHVVDEFGAGTAEDYVGQLTGTPEGAFTRPQAVVIAPASGRVYVADQSGVVDVFGPDVTVPDVTTEVATNPSATSATLHGTLNPAGVPVTDCHFEYGIDTSYGQSVPCVQTPAALGGGTSPVPVSADVSGLQPDTTYHFRLDAANADGANSGQDASVFTVTAPVVEGESFADVGSASATISAQVNAGGLATTYSVEYGTSAAYGSSTPVASLGVSESASGVLVQLDGLQAETTYHFRLLASNSLGTTRGEDVTLNTLPASALTLPDQRTYEMVTPPDNHDANVNVPAVVERGSEANGVVTSFPFQASTDGSRVAYAGDPTTGGTGSAGLGEGNEYVATRVPGSGWRQVNVQPPGHVTAVYQAFSADLTLGIFDSHEAVTADAPGGYYDSLYTRGSDGADQALTTVTPPNRGPEEFGAFGVTTPSASLNTVAVAYAGSSVDRAHLLFEANDALTANALDGGERANNLYDSVNGKLTLVNVLPNGTTQPDATFGGAPTREAAADLPDFDHAISADGSRVFWTDLSTNVLYMRSNDAQPQSPLDAQDHCLVASDACTVQVDASQGPGAGGGGRFWTASRDGSKVFFTDCSKLTPDSTAVFSSECGTDGGYRDGRKGQDLYEYDGSTGKLTDLTVDGNLGDPQGADVEGVVGASEDGRYVYFAAGGVLAAGATGGHPNLYVRHEGVTRFIGTLSPEDAETVMPFTVGGDSYGDWQPGLGNRTAEITPDGSHLVFMSDNSLTGYADLGRWEVYLYDSGPSLLRCISCSPSGERPRARKSYAAFIPVTESLTYMRKWISDDGSRVFFDSAEPLVPQDRNGRQDVYEWERDGAGSCVRSGGCIYLLSGATSSASSWLLDASASGDDVFIITRAKLAPQDPNENFDVYDARVGGVRALSPPACTGAGCQGVPPAPPIFATPSSVTFNGVGNFAPPPGRSARPKSKPRRCAKGSVRKHGRCVRTKVKKAKKPARRGK